MVSIGEKPVVRRIAIAQGEIALRNRTIRAVALKRIHKGDVLTVAEVAAIRAVKATPDIIPLCHPIPVTGVSVKFTVLRDCIRVQVTVEADYKTGVEMEALAGVAAALLTVWDMTKPLEKDDDGQYPVAKIRSIRVTRKRKGGV
ncbi:MAG: cyclic pyranopterin monophosphate synthase MoaC [Euryarchaeota archaeon]|nr:cyclic pyranopterin monophosphate synthase MoaC [Euryarchaeota archaeon]